MGTPLRVLFVEDDADDAELMLRELARGGFDVASERVATAQGLSHALENGAWDVAILDYALPGFGGAEALCLIRRRLPDLPVIIVSGAIGEETAAAAMRAGAQDYLMKQNLTRLPGAMERELREVEVRRAAQRAEEALRESERSYRELVEAANSAILQVDTAGRITFFNRFAEAFFGYAREDVLGKNVIGTIVPERDTAGNDMRDMVSRILRDPDTYAMNENENMTRDGRRVWVAWTNRALRDAEGRVVGMLSIGNDVSARKAAERKVAAYQRRLRVLGAKLILAEEGERRRIASGLHDHAVQALGLAKLRLQHFREDVKTAPQRGTIDEIQKSVEQALHETRTLLFELSPAILYELGLEAAVRWLAERVQKEHGLEVRCRADGVSAGLDGDVRVVVFRAVRELLQNVIKHAKARRVDIDIAACEDRLTLAVRDDGVGFCGGTAAMTCEGGERGFGLFDVRERLDYLGGNLKVDSATGRGTTVTLWVPIRDPSRQP